MSQERELSRECRDVKRSGKVGCPELTVILLRKSGGCLDQI